MTRDDIIRLLSEHRAELEELGVKSLSLFGSAARDEATAGSDVDILVEFSVPVGLFKFLDVKAYLEDLLSGPVDLVTPEALKRQLRDAILAEAVDAL